MSPPARPNILLIQTDQQRFDTIAALGSPVIQTPALDRLAREGTAFTSAYCPSPVCVASRCSLILGQWPHQTGCATNAPMPPDRTSLMERLQAAGYRTHGVGKMHFRPDARKLWGFDNRDFSEEGMGPDDFTLFLEENGFGHVASPHGERSEYYYIPQPSQLPARLHHTQWVGDRALAFLRTRERDRPFFCWTSFIKPHPPFEAPVPWNRLYRGVEMPLPFLPPGGEHLLTYWNRVQNRYKYRDQGTDMNLVRAMRAAYYACISFVDYNIGRVFAHLEEEGTLDGTLVLFTSDHGELLGDYGCYGKRSFLDAAARVPLLARWPARFAPGSRCDAPASLVDILPTCLAAAGEPAPAGAAGLDLARLAAGTALRDGVIGQLGHEETGLYMLLTRDVKYVYSAADRTEWLFPRAPGLPEERSVAGNPAWEAALAGCRAALVGRLREDGCLAPLDGDGWRVYPPPPEVPPGPDAWQLFQDGRSTADEFPPGYAPRLRPPGGLPVRGI